MANLSLPLCVALIFISALLGMIEARRLQRHDLASLDVTVITKHAPYLPLLLPVGLLALSGDIVLNYMPQIQCRLPLWLLIVYVPLTRGCVLLLLAFIATLCGLLVARQGHRYRGAIIIGAMLALAPMPVLQWLYTRPIAVGAPRHSNDGLILQSTGSTCVPASAANVARLFGIDKTEREMVQVLGTTESGTTVAQLVCGMRQLGFECTLNNSGVTADLHPPAILFVELGSLPHAVAYVGQRDGKSEIWDPVRGKRLMTEAQLQHMWIHGSAVEIRR